MWMHCIDGTYVLGSSENGLCLNREMYAFHGTVLKLNLNSVKFLKEVNDDKNRRPTHIAFSRLVLVLVLVLVLPRKY